MFASGAVAQQGVVEVYKLYEKPSGGNPYVATFDSVTRNNKLSCSLTDWPMFVEKVFEPLKPLYLSRP